MLPYFKRLTCEDLPTVSAEIYQAMCTIEDVPALYAKNELNFSSLLPRGPKEMQIEQFARILDRCPVLSAWLDYQGLSGKHLIPIRFFLPGDSAMLVHVDGTGGLDGGDTGEGINIPVINCAEGFSRWFTADRLYYTEQEAAELLASRGVNPQNTDPAAFSQKMHAYTSGNLYKQESAVEVARNPLDQITWFNVSIPHSGVNESKKPRVILSLRFSDKLDVEYLK